MKLKIFGETLGSFLLLYFGTGLLVFSGPFQDLLGPAVGWGFVLSALIYLVGPLSGAHLNPAVTLVMWLTKRMPGKDAIIYVICQMVGGLLGEIFVVLTLLSVIKHTDKTWNEIVNTNYLGSTVFPNISTPIAFITEVVLTTSLLLLILFLNHSKTNMYAIQSPIAVGLMIFTLVIVGGKLTGASMNPIRSFFPAIFAGGLALHQVWLYIFAPLGGSIIAALIYKYIIGDDDHLKISKFKIE